MIGQGGKYVTRLEDRYDVKINFPRDSKDDNSEGKFRENLKPDEVSVKGSRKGVAQAKQELMDVRAHVTALKNYTHHRITGLRI